MLFLARFGLVCGERTCVDLAEFASAHAAEFHAVLSLRHGTPSHDTISLVLRLIDPRAGGALSACLSAMGRHLGAGRVLAVDGKALRGAYAAGQSHMPPVMVSVFDSFTRLSIAQGRAGAGGEAEEARRLLGSLAAKGCTVAADALHCRPDTAAVIRAAGADYVLGLKANRPTLHAAAEATFARTKAMPNYADPKTLLPGLAAFGRIVSLRQIAGGPAEEHTRLFVLSRRLAPSRLAMLVRAHWGVENHLHWTLDVVFHEDDARSRKTYAPDNLALLRRLARNILEAHPSDLPIRRKMKHAYWSKDYLFNAFAYVR